MSFSILLSAILLATSAVASPYVNGRDSPATKIPQSPISLRTVTHINSTGGIAGLVSRDQARFQALLGSGRGSKGPSSKGPSSIGSSSTAPPRPTGSGTHNGSSFNGSNSADVPVTDTGLLTTVEIGVGSPPTMYQLIVDTGSSNTFVGANTPYTSTSSSKDTGNKVAVSYGSGEFSGEEFTDDVTLGNTTITSQSIDVASQSQGFNGMDGILGLGPDDLTEGTVQGESTIPTVTDNLASQGKAPAALVGISFPLTTDSNTDSGSLDFGAPDPTKFTGDIAYVPITNTPPANQFWGIDQSITYGDSNTQILKAGSGIVDTGTTLLYLASDAFQAYAQATGASQDQTTGLLKVDNPDNLKSMFFQMGDKTFEFTANAQMWPRSLNTQIGGDSGSTYLIVNDIGIPSGQGQDFINGFTFLQRFYSVFDTTNSQVGFATTSQTNATSN